MKNVEEDGIYSRGGVIWCDAWYGKLWWVVVCVSVGDWGE